MTLKVINFSHFAEIEQHNNQIYIIGLGCLLTFDGENLSYKNYIKPDDLCWGIVSDIENSGSLLFYGLDIVEPDNHPLEKKTDDFKKAFINGLFNENFFYKKNRISRKQSFHALYDLKTEKLISEIETNRESLFPQFLEGYLLSSGYNSVTSEKKWGRLSEKLEYIWEYHFDENESKGGHAYLHNKVCFLFIQRDDDLGGYQGGSIIALCVETGAEIWRTQVAGQLMELELHQDFIYCSACDVIYQVDIETGDIIKTIQTQAGMNDFNTRVRIAGDYIFYLNKSPAEFFQSKNHISVYDLVSGEHIRDIDLPQKLSFQDNVRTKVINDKFYIELAPAYIASSGGGILEVDLNNINATLDVDEGPEFTQEVITESDDKESYRLSVSHNILDEVLRFSEIEIKELALVKGRNQLNNKAFNPKFNGKIHLQIDHSALDPHEHTDEWLGVLCERINSWAEGEYYDGQAKNTVTLTYELV